jgi:hypothetical protein
MHCFAFPNPLSERPDPIELCSFAATRPAIAGNENPSDPNRLAFNKVRRTAKLGADEIKLSAGNRLMQTPGRTYEAGLMCIVDNFHNKCQPESSSGNGSTRDHRRAACISRLFHRPRFPPVSPSPLRGRGTKGEGANCEIRAACKHDGGFHAQTRSMRRRKHHLISLTSIHRFP